MNKRWIKYILKKSPRFLYFSFLMVGSYPEKSVCREGLFILPYNELAVAQGPKIQQKNKL